MRRTSNQKSNQQRVTIQGDFQEPIDAMPDAYRRGLLLEYFTVAYNLAEAAVSIAFGVLASSAALFGFGLDSIVESLSGLVLIWRLSRHEKVSQETEARLEKGATRMVAATFLILAIYIFYESLAKLIGGQKPETSLPGIVIALASLIVMPMLAWRKLKAAGRIGSKALLADAKETLACALLSLALLLGLGLNYLFGFWQADPGAGIVIGLFLVHEGIEIWREAREDGDEQAID